MNVYDVYGIAIPTLSTFLVLQNPGYTSGGQSWLEDNGRPSDDPEVPSGVINHGLLENGSIYQWFSE